MVITRDFTNYLGFKRGSTEFFKFMGKTSNFKYPSAKKPVFYRKRCKYGIQLLRKDGQRSTCILYNITLVLMLQSICSSWQHKLINIAMSWYPVPMSVNQSSTDQICSTIPPQYGVNKDKVVVND